MEEFNSDFADRLAAGLTQLVIDSDKDDKDFVVIIEGHQLPCSKALLRKDSKFFDAFFNFGPEKGSIEIQGGGIDLASFQTILKFWQTSQLDVNAANVQELLRGA